MRVLFVEDSALLRRSMVKIVRDNGLNTIEAGNGVEALARLRKYAGQIDLVILDWNMPVMDGYELLVKMRSEPDYQRIPVIMATSDGIQEDVVKAIQAGAAGYLVKPFTDDVLMAKISEVLGIPQANKA